MSGKRKSDLAGAESREPKPQSESRLVAEMGRSTLRPYRVSRGELYATVTSELRYTSCMVLRSCTPLFHRALGTLCGRK